MLLSPETFSEAVTSALPARRDGDYGGPLGPFCVRVFCCDPVAAEGLRPLLGVGTIYLQGTNTQYEKYKVPVFLNINFCKVLAFECGKDCYK